MANKKFEKSIKALEIALKDINSELVILHPTKEEYGKVCSHKRADVINAFRDYPLEIVLGMDNQFIQNGVKRGHRTEKEFIEFFESIKSMPKSMPGGMPIKIIDDPETDAEARLAEKDDGLLHLVQQSYLDLRTANDFSKKGPMGLRHDAAILRIVDHLRKIKPKTHILTYDRSLRVCSAKRVGKSNPPTVLMLDGLIQVLAIHNGGPNRSAADFAPLLSSIILKRCNPSKRTYKIQDLQWLVSINDRAADFPPETIKKFLATVVQHRLSGARADDINLAIAVNRIFQDEKKNLNEVLQSYSERAKNAEKSKDDIEEKLQETNNELAGYKHIDCRKDAIKKLTLGLLWRLPIVVALTYLVMLLLIAAIPSSSAGYLAFVLDAIAAMVILSAFIYKPIKQYKYSLSVCSVTFTTNLDKSI
jgi:DNA-binding transcriptional MerR regulator